MSVYLVKGKGWRYDFTMKGVRHTETWFRKKRQAVAAEAEKRKEVQRAKAKKAPTDMGFLELVNRRLDYVKAYRSKKYYDGHRYMARRWVERWGKLKCRELDVEMIERFVLERAKAFSPYTANVDIRSLRALFNFGRKRKWITSDPTEGLEFLPVEKRIKYIPPVEDIDAVIAIAAPNTQDYLITIRETMARVGEVNQLKWEDVSFEDRSVVLYTRKKKGGHRTPRKIPMTDKLFAVLKCRAARRDGQPWVFWHTYWSRKSGGWETGPYQDRKKLMQKLCKKARVRYFRYHPLRHSGASIMDQSNVPIGTIQRILGHENRATTEIYLHSIGQAEREAMVLFEKARAKKSHTDSHTDDRRSRRPR